MRASSAGAATTTWNYDPVSGLLTSKQYADPATGGADSQGPTYTYTPGGRLWTRTWARGTTALYVYNSAGDLKQITYSDGTTPGVTFTYDRQGRRIGVSSGGNAATLAYDDAGRLLSETYTAGVLGGLAVQNGYDQLERRRSLAVQQTGSSLTSIGYGYDPASRLLVVSNGTHSAAYSYLANAALVSNIIFQTGAATKMTTTKSYDNLNRLLSVSSVASVVKSYSYQYNSANQRTQVRLADNSYWVYQYDSLGQVVSGKKYWQGGTEVAGQQFGYAFDDIGNRESASRNGRASTYTANALNQYTQRTVPGALDVLGNANTNATVMVNLQPANRHGEYFHRELQVTNASDAVYQPVAVIGVRQNVGTGTNQHAVISEKTGHEFVPKTPEPFRYDLDGNLISDGRWTNTWDGENRLIGMQTLTSLPATVPRQKLAFRYDSQGRRISKVVSNWTGSAWVQTTNLHFVYDGWNLLAELDQTNAVVRTYTWGLDLSGSEQGAGGIGGLVAITDAASGKTYFPAYDGNGNLMALLEADTGAIAAQYEYGPFGETLRVSGSFAAANPFRFSTKYTDAETGLAYYGYRYYQPISEMWASRDPLQQDVFFSVLRRHSRHAEKANLYSFLGNEPVGRADPLGLEYIEFYSDQDHQVLDVILRAGAMTQAAQDNARLAIKESLQYGRSAVLNTTATGNLHQFPQSWLDTFGKLVTPNDMVQIPWGSIALATDVFYQLGDVYAYIKWARSSEPRLFIEYHNAVVAFKAQRCCGKCFDVCFAAGKYMQAVPDKMGLVDVITFYLTTDCVNKCGDLTSCP